MSRRGRSGRPGRRAFAALLAAAAIGGSGGGLGTPPALAAPATGALRLTVQPAAASPSAAPTWSFAAPDGTAVRCAFGPEGAVPAPAPCTSPVVGSAPADGRYLLVLETAGQRLTLPHLRDSTAELAVGGAGRPAPPPAPPAAPGRAAPPTDRSPQWRLRLEPGATATCRLDEGPAQPCTDRYVADLVAALPGEHRLVVQATDLAGNRTTQIRRYVLDETCSTCNSAPTPASAATCSTCNTTPAPVPAAAAAAALTVTGPGGPARDPDPEFVVTGPVGARECRVLRGGLAVRAWTPCGDRVRLGLTPQDRDGSYVLQARPAGAASLVASAAPYRYDLTPPAAVQVDGPSGVTARPGAWTWRPEPGTTSRCTLLRDDVVVVPAAACAPGDTPRPVHDGVHRLQVVLVDEAGNPGPEASSPEVLVDTAAPTAPAVLVVPTGGPAEQALVTAAVEPGSTSSCRAVGADGLPLAGDRGAWTACRLPLVVDLADLADPGAQIEVRLTDAAGGTSAPGSALLRAPVPDAPVVLAPARPSAQRQVSFALPPAGAPRALVCRTVHGDSAEPWAPCRDAVAVDLTGRRDGGYTLEARDPVTGRTGRATYVLDTSAPVAPVLTVEPARVGSAEVLTWRWREEAEVAYACRLTGPDGAPALDEPACRSGLQVDLAGRPDGLWTLSLTAVDRAGLTTTRTVEHLLDRRVPALSVAPAGDGQARWSVTTAGEPAVCTLLSAGQPVRGPEACGGSWAPAVDDLPDGVVQLQVRLTSPGGLTAVHLSDHVLDRTAPVLQLGLLPTGADRAPLAHLASDDPTAALTCRLGGRPWQPCGPLVPLDLTGLPDGPVVLEAQATDAGGRTGTASATHLLDTVAPAPVPVRTSSAPADPLPAWALGAPEPGAGLACTLVSPDGATAADCAAPGHTAGPGGDDDPVVLSVVAVDAAGNRSAPTAAAASPDRTAPWLRAPVPAQGPLGSHRSPRWTWLAEPGTAATCTPTRDGAAVRPPALCTSPYVLALPPDAPDGAYGLQVTVQDPAGGRSPVGTGTYLLDTTAPPPPVFTATPAGPSSLPLLRWSVDAGTDALSCQLLRNDRPLEAPRPCAPEQELDLRVLGAGPGSYALRTWARDPAGATSPPATSRPYAWSRTAGLGVLWSAAPQGHLASATGAWLFSGERDAVLHCVLLRDGQVVRERSRCNGSYPLAGLDRSGFYTLRVDATAGGRRSTVPSERSFTLELEDPAAPRLVHAPPAASPSPQASWSWTSPDDATVQCRLLRDGAPAPAWSTCTGGAASVVLPQEGVWRWQLRAVARSGRTSPVTVSAPHTYDATPPAAPALRLRAASGTAGSTAEAAWSFVLPAGTTGRCTVLADGRALVRQRACRDGLVLDLRGRPAGDHVLTLVLADPAGNTATATSTFVLLPPAAPPAGALSPSDPVPTRTVLPARAPLVAPARAAGTPPDPPRAVPARPVLRPGGQVPAVPRVPALPEPAVPAVPEPAVPALPGLPGAGTPVAGAAPGAAAPGAADRLSASGQVPGVPAPLAVALRGVVTDTLRRPALPLALLLVVGVFLLVQARLDRRDPKLAAAPVASPPPLAFGPAVRPDGGEAP